MTLTHPEHVRVINGTAKLYGIGYVHYRDGTGRIRTIGFCRVLTLPEVAPMDEGGRFRVFPDSDYEYED